MNESARCAGDSSRNVAVLGSGVAGLTAAHVLAKHDRVTLFESDSRLGGHAHTHRVDVDGETVALDSGFIVHNDRTYPTLLRLFDELSVPTQQSDMSMSIRSDTTGIEYAGGKGLSGLLPSLRTVSDRRYLRMLREVLRFHAAARRVLDDNSGESLTIAEFLAREQFSDFFRDHFMTPLIAAVWSCAPDGAGDYPARYLFAFLRHHGMLTVLGSPTWRTVTGGSATYVLRIAAGLDEVYTGTAVRRIAEIPGGVRVVDEFGVVRTFDAVVVATHPAQALAMLDDPSAAERAVLGAIPYATNHAQLHTDTTLLPVNPRARASWNYLVPATPGAGVLVTYDLTRLMRIDLPGDRRFLVTLGGAHRVDPRTVIAEMTYEHPIYTTESVAAQGRLGLLGSDRVAFAGAYHGWGFHEDGALSGLRAAERIGGSWGETELTSAAVGALA